MPGFVIKLKRTYADGRPKYRAAWHHPYERGIHKQRIFPQKEVAQRWLRHADAEAAAGYLKPQNYNVTFANLVNTWSTIHLPELAPRTQARYDGILRNYLLPAWGSRTLSTIDREFVQRYFAKLRSQHLSPGQLRKIQVVASSVFAKGVELDHIRYNPVAKIKLPPPPQHDMLVMTPAEIRVLADTIHPRFRTAIYTAAYTGLRASELWALRRQDIDIPNNRLHVARAVKRSYGKGSPDNAPLFGPPKNGKTRTVSLPTFLTNLLAEHLTSLPQAETALAFTAEQGGVVRHELFMRRFYRRALRAAVAAGTLSPDKLAFRFHDLRHTAATLAIATGASAQQIRDRLGHASIQTTFDRYGHLFEGHDDKMLAKLNAAYEDTDTIPAPQPRHLKAV